MKEYEEELEHLKVRFQAIAKKTDTTAIQTELNELEEKTSLANFWDQVEESQKIMSKIGFLKKELETIDSMQKKIDELAGFVELIKEESDIEEKTKAEKELEEEVASIEKEITEMEIKTYLSGKFDKGDAIITIYAGQGGTEACDWAEMLMRMYLRFFERKNWIADISHIVQGGEAGISSVSIEVSGPFAYGILRHEHGTHRLVRISPFNAQGLRQTSFAGLEVMPVIEETEFDIEIKEEEIEFKAIKAGGPGGQKVNKTSSAVQIKHIPTGIQVNSSNRKSQHQNREAAMKILRAKLYQIEEEKKLKEVSDIKGEYKIAGWGNQIRNYILHPYKLVKDLRTNAETSNVEAVLDGDLDIFIDAEVRL